MAILISVIVPAYNEEKMIRMCLKAIRAQKFRDYELIVVDGHSTDNTVKIAKKYADLVLFDSGRGPGAARNLGAQKAKGKIFAFVDADTVVCKNWLGIINENFVQNKKLVGLGGPVLALDGTKFDHWAMNTYSKIASAISRKIPFFVGSNCAYLRNSFFKADGFDEELPLLEDSDLSKKMGKQGLAKFDEKLVVRTSMRRIRQKDYGTILINYGAVYAGLLLGFNMRKRCINYLRDIEK